MTMKWDDIKQKKPPTRESARLLAEERAHVARELALAAVRRQRGLRQSDVAERLGVHQSNVSRLEQSDDPFVSTLERYVEALGGRLEVRAVFEDEEVVLNSDLEPA
jgi:predicted transcriptional regulator